MFKSQKQRAFMYSQHPKIAKEFEAQTPPGKLPTYAPSHVNPTPSINPVHEYLKKMKLGGM